MSRSTSTRLRLLSFAVIAYMMLAFAWWSILLFTKNQDAFLAKRDKLRILMIAEGSVANDQQFFQSERYLVLKQQYDRQEYMILGEAVVFTISLLIGLWLINRGYKQEVASARQQHNFLLSITHELKSPLASIRLVLETLQKRNLPQDKTEKLAKGALIETERLNTLVNDLLLSARLEAAYQPHREPVDLSQMLEDIIERLGVKYPKVHFEFHKQTATQRIDGDESGLASVIINLLENAVKYSSPPVEIEANIRQEEEYLILEIADNGKGINEKEKTKIFDKFYRIGNEDTRKTKGTGLGLYIVNQIVKAHNGKISVEDHQPEGTLFRIKLPLKSN